MLLILLWNITALVLIVYFVERHTHDVVFQRCLAPVYEHCSNNVAWRTPYRAHMDLFDMWACVDKLLAEESPEESHIPTIPKKA